MSQAQAQQMQQQMYAAAIATTASQTLLGKLGSAFWDAFSGSSGSGASSSKAWDADKVRKVLEGKAVVKVVDVEPEMPKTPKMSPNVVMKKEEKEVNSCHMSALLEESMRSLTLSTKK
jgi:bZIP-type transcription factor MBZ1